MYLIIAWFLPFLRVFVVGSEEAEDDVPGMVEQNEERPCRENCGPYMSNFLRNPLRIVEVCNFETEISEVNEAPSESKCVNNGLFT